MEKLGLTRVFHKAGAACLRAFLLRFVGGGQERLDAASSDTVQTSSVLEFGSQRRKGREGGGRVVQGGTMWGWGWVCGWVRMGGGSRSS